MEQDVKIAINIAEEITVIASRAWKCCKCREEMYRGENSCNYCKHSRCNSCRRLE